MFQRAAVAIVLMGALVAPREICLQQTHKAAHRCCERASQQHRTAQADCCTASAPLPAVVVAPDLPGPAPLAVAQGFVPVNPLLSAIDLPAVAVTPPHSPPPGAFSLRI